MSPEAAAAGTTPTGLVTLIVGDFGRTGPATRSRRPAPASGTEARDWLTTGAGAMELPMVG